MIPLGKHLLHTMLIVLIIGSINCTPNWRNRKWSKAKEGSDQHFFLEIIHPRTVFIQQGEEMGKMFDELNLKYEFACTDARW
jgi:hypothetical protein